MMGRNDGASLTFAYAGGSGYFAWYKKTAATFSDSCHNLNDLTYGLRSDAACTNSGSIPPGITLPGGASTPTITFNKNAAFPHEYREVYFCAFNALTPTPEFVMRKIKYTICGTE